MPRALSPLLSVGRKASLGLVDIGAGEFAAKAAKLIQFLDAEQKAKPSTEKVGDVVSPPRAQKHTEVHPIRSGGRGFMWPSEPVPSSSRLHRFHLKDTGGSPHQT